MLDLHAASAAGSASYTNQSTVLAGNDGAPLAGTPVLDNAYLIQWGALTTIADTLLKIKLSSQDQLDTTNAEELIFGAASVSGIQNVWDYMESKAQRTIAVALNTGAGNTMGYFTDLYAGGNVTQHPIYGKSGKNAWYSQVFGGALTAITWGTVGFSPTAAIPPGKYAIQGAAVSQLTNYGLIRFQHANFGGLFPGFPVIDQTKAAARAVTPNDPIFLHEGYQFSILSERYKVPCEPVFSVTAQGTGLNIWFASITADTPQIRLNLVKVD